MIEERSKIEELKKSLYSRTGSDVRSKRKLHFREKEFDLKTNWEHSEEDLQPVKLNEEYEDHSMSFFTKLLIGSVLFFVVALGLGAYFLFNGSNIVSAENVDILVSSPASVSGGEPVSLNIQVYNKNNIKLEVVDLVVDFPDGTANPDNVSQELKTFRELLGDIESGGMAQKTVRAAFFGEENSKKIVNVKVEYRVKGSNAIFYKEKAYEVLVSSSPVSLNISSFTEVNSGQQFDTTVTVTSNSAQVLKNLLLKGVYPFGFAFISSDMKPVGDNATWKIGDLPPKGKKTIVIRGKLEGQDDESRIFRFSAGASSAKNASTIGTQYLADTQEIKIKKPFITVNVTLDSDSQKEEYIGEFNKPIQVEVSWFNNLPTAIIDGEIHVKLSGTAFEKTSVAPEQGFYQSASNEIVWSKITTKELGSIGAGESGRVGFSVTPHDSKTAGKPLQNPDLSLSVNVNGKRISESNVPENIVSSATRHIKVASNVALSGQVVRSIGAFPNTGPIPPKSEQQTTYTVIWTVSNTSSNVSNAKVVSSLPPHVKWAGKTSPAGEDITYNNVNGQITWNIGNVGAYTGSGARKKEVSFQIILEPGITQIGQTLTLIGDSVLTAVDDFTNSQLTTREPSENTRYSTDPAFKNGDETVVQ